MSHIDRDQQGNESPPAREAWIEIVVYDDDYHNTPRRLPRGRRGLKWTALVADIHKMRSPPAREAWIEMALISGVIRTLMSPPAREAWIEI